MPTVALNLVLPEPQVLSGEWLNATVLLDSSDPDTVVQECFAEIRGTGRTGWVNIHTDKIYETAQVGGGGEGLQQSNLSIRTYIKK